MNDAEQLFRANPFSAIKFLRPLLLFGSVISSVLTVMTAMELAEKPPWWTANGRATINATVNVLPFAWVWTQFIIMCVQWPIRFLLLHHILRLGSGTVEEAAEQLTGLARSRAWRGNQQLGGMHALTCLVGGAVYFFSTDRGTSLCRLVLVHVVTFFVRSIVTFAWFAISFAWELPAGQYIPGASASLAFRAKAYAQELPTVHYAPPDAGDSAQQAAAPSAAPSAAAAPSPPAQPSSLQPPPFRFNLDSCVVCLNDYVPGEALKSLSCSHYFHEECLAQWLSHRRTCPICQRWDSRPLGEQQLLGADAVADAAIAEADERFERREEADDDAPQAGGVEAERGAPRRRHHVIPPAADD